jgi:glycosyltransferase involved in cell wall biosynthesis
MYNISIIIPIYNGEEYLKECLDSVVDQDIENKEIICVDDGSTDRSIEIVQDYIEIYPDIKLLCQKNQGAAVARNNALDVACGKYIAFMDADDFYIDKTGLRKMVEECESKEAMICGAFRSLKKKDEVLPADTFRAEFKGKEEIKKLRFFDFQYDYYYQSYIFRKDFLNKNDLRFPNYRRYQDPPFLSKTMWAAKEFLVLPIELYCYRVRLSAINYSFLQMNDTLKGIRENLLFAKENGLRILFKNNKDRINQDFYYVINSSIEKGNMDAIRLLIDLEEIVRQAESTRDDEIQLMSLKKVYTAIRKSKMSGNWDYRFPYEHIPYRSRIALYGAGNVGRTMHAVLTSTGYGVIAAWVDSRYQDYQKEGLSVNMPEYLLEQEFDYVLIAVEKEELYMEIREEIEKKKLNNGKPIIGPVQKKEN